MASTKSTGEFPFLFEYTQKALYLSGTQPGFTSECCHRRVGYALSIGAISNGK